ncbi:MAG: VCBS repeat-containing protein [Planctomycetota bacterium]
MALFAHASASSLFVAILSSAALGQGTAGLFDDNALSITDSQSRFELALDANEDGELELLDWWPYLGHGGTISVGLYHRRFHPGSWWERGRTFSGPDGNYHGDTATRAGDFDGDDEAVLVSRGQVDVFDLFGFEMRRRLVWTPSTALTGTYREAAILDFTGDGRDDLVVVDGAALRLLESSGSGGAFAFTERASLPTSDVDVEVEIADVVGTSTPDLLVLVPGGASVLWIMDVEGGQLQSAERIDVRAPVGGAKLGLASGDVDGDGDTDAVLFGHDGRSQVARNLGDGVWSLEHDAVGGPATDLADLDLDGICCGSQGNVSNALTVMISR